MDKLRVDSGIKTIEVNDNGDCISIPVGDATFYERFAAVMKSFEQKDAEYIRRGKELIEKHKDNPDDVEATVDGVNLYVDLCKYTCAELDKLFGEGCCRKVFAGVEIPSVEMIGDFFDQITPLLNQYTQERNQKISRMYNRDRKGKGRRK